MSTTTEFRIDSAEGLPIRGTLTVPGEPSALVVVLHGFKGFRQWGFFPWVSEYLAGAGLAVCRFDFSRNGVGEGGDEFDRLDLFAGDTYSIQIADVLSVVSFLERDSRLRNLPRFLLGHSRGGGVALLAAHDVANLRGVVTWSAISTVQRWDEATREQWRRAGHIDVVNSRTNQVMPMSMAMLDDVERNSGRLDIVAAAHSLRVPLLILHGASDTSVAVAEAKTIAGAARDASLVVLQNASHTFGAIHPLIHVPAELRFAAAVTRRFVETYS